MRLTRKILQSAFIGTALCSAAVMMSAPEAYAQDKAATEGRQFGSKAGQAVNDALQFMNTNQWAAASAKLNEVLLIPDLNPYEKSTVYQMMGSVYYEQDNFPGAITAFENSINAGGLLKKESDSLRVNIAQLLIADGKYAQGAQMLENWLNRGGTMKPQYLEMLMQAWVQSDNYTKALPWAQRWFREASPKERKHFDMLNYLYNNLKMPGKQADIVKEMITRWPDDRQLWDSWTSLLAYGGREQEAFEVNKMLYLGGAMTTDQDLSKIVQYYGAYDMPYQAAKILEREMNAGRMKTTTDRLVQLSNLFRQAREYKRAIPILERAAKQSNKSKLYADLGEALYHSGQCNKAEDAFKKAMSLGYDAGKSWMLIATCRYEAAQAEDRAVCSETTAEQRKNSTKNQKRNHAIAAYNQVPSSSREKRNAGKWISFIKAEAKAVEDRCVFEEKVVEDLCFIKIRQAYDAQVFTNSFDLDEECMVFKEKFDGIYRVTVKTDG